MLIPKTTIKRRFLLKRSKDTLARNRDKECFPFTLSLSPLQLFIWHTHTVNRFPSSNQVHTTLRLMTFSLHFFLIRIIHHSRTNKKRLKVRFASRSTLYHPNETLVPTQNRSVCAFDGSKFFSPFFASARCLNGTSPPHHRQNSKVYLIFRLACFSIENNTSTLIRIGLETRNNVHGN